MNSELDVRKIADELIAILLKKHKDYGPLNITQAPGGAMNGLRVRMHDKLARLNHLVDAKRCDTPNYESIEDTLIDLANYAIIALLVQRNQWAGTTSQAKKINYGSKEAPFKKNPHIERPTNPISRPEDNFWRGRLH